jgi:DNA-binding SARP family transcriptional activator
MLRLVQVSVLGAVEVRRDGQPVDLGTPKQRALVAVLALAHGWPVSVDGIVDALWGDDAPPGVAGTLQSYVSGLRRALEPDRAPRTPATVLVTAAPGYALRVPDEQVDAHRFEQAVALAHKTLMPLAAGWGPVPLDRATLEEERGRLDEVLATWRGTPYADLGDADGAAAERTRLEGLRLVALEDRALAALALGDHATTAAELEALTGAHPLRERLWELRAVALFRSGRQADALEVLATLRTVLDDELGLEPSAGVRDLQTALLRQDPALAWVPPEGASAARPSAPAAAPAADVRHPGGEQVAPWPMVGRDAELAGLMSVLGAAEGGRPSCAVLTGEPGIGKSRLAGEMLLQARRRNVVVLHGRCSQDDGAPPLWPWQAVLEGIGLDLVGLVETAGTDEGGRFRAWEMISSAVLAAARERPVALLMDDLHWADAPTLRVLRLLVESATDERLLVVGAWRAHPAPTGPLADLAEAFGRAHALRLDLHGLPERAAGAIFEAVTGHPVEATGADLLVQRTDGNPFFLVELSRLAAERGGGVDVAEGRLPAAVGDVIDRRLSRLPDDTVSALRFAAVIGRRFDLASLALAARIDEDDALDVVEPAQAAGLVREHGVDHYLFTHALVRDRLRDGIGASRKARVHARIAEALSQAPGRESEEARHWREAGPLYAARAWRSAVAAAALARRLHDHDEAAVLLDGALASMADDPAATGADRFAVLMDLAEAHRWAGRQGDLVLVTEQAIAVARDNGDHEAVAQAAVAVSTGVLWRAAPPGETNEVVGDALQESLDRLPDGDSELRCRVMLALAVEADGEEAVRWADEALAMARRLEVPALVMAAHQVAHMEWLPSTAADRLERITEALAIAREIGDERAAVVCGTLRAGALGELGQVPAMREQIAGTKADARRLRIAYGDLVLTGLDIAWWAMAGRWEECERGLAHLAGLAEDLDHGSVEETLQIVRFTIASWAGRPADAIAPLQGFVEMGAPFGVLVAVCQWRAGDEAAARATYAEHGPPPEEEANISPLVWCQAAELAAYLGDADLAAAASRVLTPWAGRPCAVGVAVVMAPVDAYLALATATCGRAQEAAAHADAALGQAEDWGLTVVVDWIRDLRERYGF